MRMKTVGNNVLDKSYTSNLMSSSELRKINKPIVEKKRRERINGCLDELKQLLLLSTNKRESSTSKLEKADILEMAVRHLRTTQPRSSALQTNTGNGGNWNDDVTQYKNGYNACAREVITFLNHSNAVNTADKSRLLRTLTNKINEVNRHTSRGNLNHAQLTLSDSTNYAHTVSRDNINLAYTDNSQSSIDETKASINLLTTFKRSSHSPPSSNIYSPPLSEPSYLFPHPAYIIPSDTTPTFPQSHPTTTVYPTTTFEPEPSLRLAAYDWSTRLISPTTQGSINRSSSSLLPVSDDHSLISNGRTRTDSQVDDNVAFCSRRGDSTSEQLDSVLSGQRFTSRFEKPTQRSRSRSRSIVRDTNRSSSMTRNDKTAYNSKSFSHNINMTSRRHDEVNICDPMPRRCGDTTTSRRHSVARSRDATSLRDYIVDSSSSEVVGDVVEQPTSSNLTDSSCNNPCLVSDSCLTNRRRVSESWSTNIVTVSHVGAATKGSVLSGSSWSELQRSSVDMNGNTVRCDSPVDQVSQSHHIFGEDHEDDDSMWRPW